MKKSALTIAGSDPSGGAGIQADLKTFHQMSVYGMSVITLITVQNTRGVGKVKVLEPEWVKAQLQAVLEDIRPDALKTGALGSAEVIEAVAELASGFSGPLVVDPVMISKYYAPLLDDKGIAALVTRILPAAFLVTPNIHEASVLAGFPIASEADLRRAAQKIQTLGPKAVLIKGGHFGTDADDILYYGGKFEVYTSPRIETVHTHGTGCTYSAAITAQLALGRPLDEAVWVAKKFITEAIATNPGLGYGMGPVNHHARVEQPGFVKEEES